MSYYAIVGRISALRPIPGADKIQVAEVLGTSVIVGVEAALGDLGLLFPEGGQISPAFLKHNNLYRDSTCNQDPEKNGYFEEAGRVRAQPFRGVRSEGFFCPLSYLGVGVHLDPDTQVTEWGGAPLCWKYIKPGRQIVFSGSKRARKRLSRSVPGFREHDDTEQWRFYSHKIKDPACRITITQKYHGTSGRWGYHEVTEDPIGRWLEAASFERLAHCWNRWARWARKRRPEYVVGSRRVIIWSSEKAGFHGKEEFRFQILEKLKPFLTEGMTIYGEIVGEANNTLLMPAHDLCTLKDKTVARAFGPRMEYRYGCPAGTHDVIVYRITEGGQDWLPSKIRQFCLDCKLRYPYTFIEEGVVDDALSLVKALGDNIRTADAPDTLNEGVVIRLDYTDGRPPIFLKEKNFYFKVCEGIAKEVDGDPEDES